MKAENQDLTHKLSGELDITIENASLLAKVFRLARKLSHASSTESAKRLTEYGRWNELVELYDELGIILRDMANEGAVRERIINNASRTLDTGYERDYRAMKRRWLDGDAGTERS